MSVTVQLLGGFRHYSDFGPTFLPPDVPLGNGVSKGWYNNDSTFIGKRNTNVEGSRRAKGPQRPFRDGSSTMKTNKSQLKVTYFKNQVTGTHRLWLRRGTATVVDVDGVPRPFLSLS